MLSELCGYLRNYFDKEKHFGDFVIENGVISAQSDLGLLENQYIRIVGSLLNDGVYQYHADGIEGLQDEAFDGAVWSLAIPKAVVDLNTEIDAWRAKYEAVDGAAMSPFSSENISANSYSYTMSSAESVGKMNWQNFFAAKLSQWRKI